MNLSLQYIGDRGPTRWGPRVKGRGTQTPNENKKLTIINKMFFKGVFVFLDPRPSAPKILHN